MTLPAVENVAAGGEALAAALELARCCPGQQAHSRQVTRMALKLFDELRPLHRLGADERLLLTCAGLLHDIGWVEGQQRHHKTALRLILAADELPLDERERRIVACVARYHRKALPAETHKHFMALRRKDRQMVAVLAGVLRVADGLDRSHSDLVRDVTCEVCDEEILVHCLVSGVADSERRAATEKADLLERAFGRRVVVGCCGG